ncbi:MAG TPA: VOC family protein [Verrucomicrobiae bacterium]|nr:VOC family protein [Verrucomicrobiae bacterium]
MQSKPNPIPKGFHSVTPYLAIKGASEAIEFYKRALGATERFRLPGPDGKTVGHAELVIGDSIIMVADEFPGMNTSPTTVKATTVCFAVYVENVDQAFEKAIKAGGTVRYPVENKFWGDRAGTFEDPFGHQWSLMTHVEDVPPHEMERRMKEECGKMAEMSKG